MDQCEIVVRISLILAAPAVVCGIFDARSDVMVAVAEDVATMPKEWLTLEAAASASSWLALGSLQHSSSSDSSISGYSWLLDRPPVVTIEIYDCTVQRRRTSQYLLTPTRLLDMPASLQYP